MNLKVFALMNKSDVSTLLEKQLLMIVGTRPVVKDNSHEILSLMDMMGSVDVLLIDGNSFKFELEQFLVTLKMRRIAIKDTVVIGDFLQGSLPSNVFVSSSPAAILDHLKEKFGNHEDISGDFISIPISCLVHFSMFPFDLYIRLSEGRHVKRFKAYESVDRDAIRSLKEKGVVDAYFDRRHNREFSVMLLNSMINKVEREDISLDEKLGVVDEVYMTTREITQSLGFPTKVIDLCESVIKSIDSDVAKGKDHLSAYLEKLKRPEYSFNYRLIELTSYFSLQLVEKLEAFPSNNVARLFIFSSLFCDLALPEAEWIHVRSEDQMNNFRGFDVKRISSHAKKSAEMILTYKNAPTGADKIIREHHGSFNGMGFSDHDCSNVWTLSKYLIIGQRFAYEILSKPKVPYFETISQVSKSYEDQSLKNLALSFVSACQNEEGAASVNS